MAASRHKLRLLVEPAQLSIDMNEELDQLSRPKIATVTVTNPNDFPIMLKSASLFRP